ncbi:unnamed protein product [Allacma fusca]|uniref:Uncharacterized protein n=1 Tax=Allacma fusca TaxID=39272 RepID=A0A8J2LP60_9HEXA|nr:unnamed protein product [Allacma fusca]
MPVGHSFRKPSLDVLHEPVRGNEVPVRPWPIIPPWHPVLRRLLAPNDDTVERRQRFQPNILTRRPPTPEVTDIITVMPNGEERRYYEITRNANDEPQLQPILGPAHATDQRQIAWTQVHRRSTVRPLNRYDSIVDEILQSRYEPEPNTEFNRLPLNEAPTAHPFTILLERVTAPLTYVDDIRIAPQ